MEKILNTKAEEAFFALAILLITLLLFAYPLNSAFLMNFSQTGAPEQPNSSYKNALALEKLANGKEVAVGSPFLPIMAKLFSLWRPDAITFIKISQLLLALASAYSLYYMLKKLFSAPLPALTGTGSLRLPQHSAFLPALIGTTLALSSLPFILAYLPTVFSERSFAFALFLISAMLFLSSTSLVASLVAGFIAGISLVFLPVLAPLLIAVSISLIAQSLCKRKGIENALAFALLSLLPLTRVSFPPIELNYTLALTLLPLLAFSILGAGFAIFSKTERKPFLLMLFISSVLLAFIDPLLSVFGFAVLSAFAFSELAAAGSKTAMLVVGCAIFAVVLAITSSLTALSSAVALSLIVAALGLWALYMYKDASMAPYAFIFIAAIALLAPILIALPYVQQKPAIDNETADALSWIKDNLPQSARVLSFGSSETIEFLSGRQSLSMDSEMATFLMSDITPAFLKEKNITHILIDGYIFDRMAELRNMTGSKARIVAFDFGGYSYDERGAIYGVFNSSEGVLLYMEADPNTGRISMEGDAFLLGGARVPITKLLKLNSKEGNLVRLIYPREEYEINLFNLFFGERFGMKQAYPEGKNGRVRIFGIE